MKHTIIILSLLAGSLGQAQECGPAICLTGADFDAGVFYTDSLLTDPVVRLDVEGWKISSYTLELSQKGVTKAFMPSADSLSKYACSIMPNLTPPYTMLIRRLKVIDPSGDERQLSAYSAKAVTKDEYLSRTRKFKPAAALEGIIPLGARKMVAKKYFKKNHKLVKGCGSCSPGMKIQAYTVSIVSPTNEMLFQKKYSGDQLSSEGYTQIQKAAANSVLVFSQVKLSLADGSEFTIPRFGYVITE